MDYTAKATLWIWNGASGGAWHFCTITGGAAEALHGEAAMQRIEQGRKRGWGALKVRAAIGGSTWETSLFPDKASGGWLLPVKAAVRKAEGLVAGDTVVIELAVL
jgi:hypothetical protein